MATRITIRENIQADALEVTLEGADLPLAAPREQPAFESGGPVERELIYLPGLEKPIVQVQQPRERPMVITGAFRVHQHLQDGGTDVDHARAMRDALEEIRYRCNPLTVSWGSQARDCFLAEARFGEESETEISYELTFDVLAGPNRPERTPPQDPVTQPPSTIAEQLRAELAERRAEWEALRGTEVSKQVIDAVVVGLDTIDSGAGDAQTGAVALEQSSGPAKSAAVSTVMAHAAAARASTMTLRDVLATTTLAAAVPSGDPAAVTALWGAQFRTGATLLSALDQLRAVSLAARRRVQAGTRLYQVRPGDTLEAIARQTLGNAARVGDLGVRADQLVPGRLLRIPQN
jgi:hypothetical protein